MKGQRKPSCQRKPSWMLTLAAGLLFPALLGAQSAQAAGEDMRKTYILNCAGCHGLDGFGLPSQDIPDFHESGRFLGVPEGRDYLIQVPGASQSRLNDKDLAALMNWILTTFAKGSLTAPFLPYTEEEIHRLRPNKATDAVERRAALRRRLEQFYPAHPAETTQSPHASSGTP